MEGAGVWHELVLGTADVVVRRLALDGTEPARETLPLTAAADGTARAALPEGLEGLTSGPSTTARWGRPGADLGPLHQDAVGLSSCYIAQLRATVTYAVAPQRIVVGGGVLKTAGLLDAVRDSSHCSSAGRWPSTP